MGKGILRYYDIKYDDNKQLGLKGYEWFFRPPIGCSTRACCVYDTQKEAEMAALEHWDMVRSFIFDASRD